MNTSNKSDRNDDAAEEVAKTPVEKDKDGKEEKPTEPKEEQETQDSDDNKGDECCICLEELPKDASKFARMTCCGQGMHIYCDKDLTSMNMGGTCPLCRAPTPTSHEEIIKQLRPWVKKKKAWALAMMGEKYRGGKGVKQSYEMAKKLYELAAQQGDATAQYILGFMYYKGQGVTQSYTKAREFYERASDQSDPDALGNLGTLYANGFGVQQNFTKARDLFNNAVAQGNMNSVEWLQFVENEESRLAALDPNAIVCSLCGLPETETRNFSKTKCPCKSTWYCNTTCQKKHWKEHRNECKRLIAEIKRQKKMRTEAMTTTQEQEEVGERKEVEDKTTTPKKEKEEEGDECPICLDEVSLLSKLKRFACCGKVIHTHCCTDLLSSKMKWNCPLCRAKTPTSHEEQIKQLRPWLKKKKAWSQHMMGQHYRKGEGVKQSYEIAMILFEQAAQQENTSAIFDLGNMYYKGIGVEQSYERAFAYYEQAAHLGVAEAQYNLGAMYEKGIGVEQSYERAFEYYEQAAQLGEEDAQYNLGIMYMNGTGVEKDIAKTREWWTKAAAQGEKYAIKYLKLINS
jgi:TPR repeat protein